MLTHAHSGLRWVVLVLILVAIFNAVMGKGKKSFEKSDLRLNMLAMTSTHIQLIIGLVLYFMSDKVTFAEGWMKNATTRFYGMEHMLGMIIAIGLITVGYSKSKRASSDEAKFKATITFMTLGLIAILASIPWPFRDGLGGHWF